MIFQYTLQGTEWVQIAGAGVRIRAWIDEDYDDAQGVMDIRFWSGNDIPTDADFTKARRLYGLNSNYDPMIQEPHSDVSYFWARCRNPGDKALVSVEEIRPTTVIASIGAGERNTDSFGRLPVSLPKAVSEFMNEYNDAPLAWENFTVGTGIVQHIPAESSVRLSTGGTAVGPRALRQTRQYGRYRPGRSKLLLFTGVLGKPIEFACRRAGLFDDFNGVFFCASNGEYNVVIRSSTSGSVVNRLIPQHEWNGNRLDGTGAGNINADPDLNLLGWIDLEWLGVGQVRFGIVMGGKYVVCHQEDHSNKLPTAYMQTANLPIRYEVVNIGPSPATEIATVKSICAVVLEEGDGDLAQGYDFTADSGATLKAVSSAAFVPIMAIRPKLTFGGKVNRAVVNLSGIEILAEKSSIRWRLLYNPVITGGSWVSVDGNSTIEFNNTITSFSGGTPVKGGQRAASNQSKTSLADVVSNFFPLVVDYAGTGRTTWLLVAQCFSAAQAADVAAEMSWRELY